MTTDTKPPPNSAGSSATTGRPASAVGAVVAVGLVLLAVGSVLLPAPDAIRVPVTLAAVAATALRLARHRPRPGAGLESRLDGALVAVGGVLVALILVGFLLGVIGIGLGTTSWTLATAGLALAALGFSVRRPPTVVAADGDPDRRREVVRTLPWAVAAAAVTVVALLIAWTSATGAETAPVQLSLGSLEGPRATVTVTAEEATGPLELRTDTAGGTPVSYPLFEVAAGGEVTTDVVVPTRGRTTITVNNPGEAEPLRTLVVNR